MDLYCQVCGEPYEVFFVTDDMTPLERADFHAGRGCPSCKGRKQEKTPFRATLASAMTDVLGDDIDGIAAEMEDAEALMGSEFWSCGDEPEPRPEDYGYVESHRITVTAGDDVYTQEVPGVAIQLTDRIRAFLHVKDDLPRPYIGVSEITTGLLLVLGSDEIEAIEKAQFSIYQKTEDAMVKNIQDCIALGFEASRIPVRR